MFRCPPPGFREHALGSGHYHKAVGTWEFIADFWKHLIREFNISESTRSTARTH